MGTTTKTKHVLKQRRESNYYMDDLEISFFKTLKHVFTGFAPGGPANDRRTRKNVF